MSTLKTTIATGLALLALSVTAQAETLRAMADVGFAPYVMLDSSNETTGYNVDILKEVTKRIGDEGYTVADVPFSSMFVALNSGQYDIAISATQVTPERAKNILFTEPYIEADFGIMTLASKGQEVKSLEDLRGKSIAVNSGSLPDKWFTANAAKYGWTLVRYGKTSDAAQAVITGRDFALASGEGSIAWIAKKNKKVLFNFSVPTDGSYAFAFKKGNTALRDRVENALECMKLDGTIAKIHEKWIGKPPRTGSIAYTPQPGYGAKGMEGYDATEHAPKCK